MSVGSILKVAIPVPLHKVFDYLPPLTLVEDDPLFLPGMRILVPFGKQKKIGMIVAVVKQSDHPLEKLKHAYQLLDKEPLFPKALLDLIAWTTRYYHGSPGEVFEAALPTFLRKMPKEKKAPLSPKPSKIKELSLEINTCQSFDVPIHVPSLNAAQKLAADLICKNIGSYKTFLLEGVTGSGKTEVYIQVIQAALQQQKQALILVPEIGLTPQLLERFQKRFNVPIATLHSSLSEKKRFEAWEKARTGEAPIIIGTRLASFVPLKAPGIFIIDEEHDPSFKQQEGFRYHARDLIIMRGSLENCPVVLGSATPSLESLNNSHLDRFQHLSLPNRAGNATFPTLQVLDIRHKKLEEGLSAQLLHKMREHIEKNGQVLLFLNRRGFAPVLMCFACGWMANCDNCDSRMTFHYQSNQLQCHHCEVSRPVFSECPACHHKDLKPVGIGTERLEATLNKHFPQQTITRIDRDTTRKKGEFQKKLTDVHSGETHILLGTQMIAKGHHFPNVTLVAILDIDHALFSTDFRSTEKMGQLITQVAGRSGRAERPGEVVLQTCHPEHPLLKAVLEEGYPSFSRKLLTERKSINLPPYSYQALLRAESNKPKEALEFLSFLKAQFSTKNTSSQTTTPHNSPMQLLGPIPAPMERRNGKHRAQLLFQNTKRSELQRCLSGLIEKISTYPKINNIRWSLDVDPIDMY